MTPVVGRVVATDQRPSTSHLFHFWTEPDSPVGIGALVRVEGEGRTAWGVVTEGLAYQDVDFLTAALPAAAGDPSGGAIPPPRSIRLFTAAVLRHLPEEPLQPVAIGTVHLAGDDDVVTALRMEGYAPPEGEAGIPCGVFAAGSLQAPVYLDADFLLGPEAAHLNISGMSGLATKTSAVAFLLAAVFQRLAPSKGRVAAVCFNVKGPDLCFLDQGADLGELDRALYRRLGLRPEPFERVRVYAPFKPDGVNLNTLRTHEQLAANTVPLVWGLREVLDFAEVLLNKDDIDAKADAFVDFLGERVIGREFTDEQLRPGTFRVQTFADLDGFFRAIFEYLETRARGGEIWRTHHVATIRKIRNRLGNITTRAKGLVTDDGAVSDLPWGAFEDRAAYVVDVAGLDPLAQDLVFARVVSKLREHLERRDLGVDQVVVFVDELNKYAPADGPDTYVRSMLLDISERGRYLGLTMFSAQQFRSQVHRRVVGNAGTAIYGRMDSDELATSGYATLPPAVRAKLAGLPKGELMVRHPHFMHPVFVRFPRPAVLTGREGVERFPPTADLPFAMAVTRRLRALDPSVSPGKVAEVIEGRGEDEVRRALHLTVRERPDLPMAFFVACLGRRVPTEAPAPRRGVPGVRDLPDPYA